MHPFENALRLTPAGENRFAGTTTPAYANMVGPFGGITYALMLNAVMEHPEKLGEPVTLTVNFAAPVADGDFEIVATPVRTNRSTQHWTLALVQGTEVATTGTAVCAVRRETWSAQEVEFTPDLPRPSELPKAALAGLPVWVSRYDMRYVDGGLAFDGIEQADSLTRLWIRDDPPRPLSLTSLAAMCDGFFPRVFLRRHRLVPAGTVSMTTFFHADAALLAEQGDRHVLGVARGLNFRNGYFDQSAELWSDAGELLASSHQWVYFRE
jgi:acyl-CoA thioesterase